MRRRLGRRASRLLLVTLAVAGAWRCAGLWRAEGATLAPAVQGANVGVLENDRVRVHAISHPPRARGPEHEHVVPRAVVVLAGGTLELRDAAGSVKTLTLKTGDVVWRPAEKHSVANTGSTAIRLVEVDVLECAGAAQNSREM